MTHTQEKKKMPRLILKQKSCKLEPVLVAYVTTLSCRDIYKNVMHVAFAHFYFHCTDGFLHMLKGSRKQ